MQVFLKQLKEKLGNLDSISILYNISKNINNFFYKIQPGAGSNLANISFPKVGSEIIFIKELMFRSSSNKNINETIKKIKDL